MLSVEEMDHWARFIVEQMHSSLPEGLKMTVILVQDMQDSKDQYMSACASSCPPLELYDVLMGTAQALPEKVSNDEVATFLAKNRGKGN